MDAGIPRGTLVLRRSDVSSVLSLADCTAAVEEAFRMHGEGSVADPAIAGVHVPDGGFHMKAGALQVHRPYFAAKTNANFMNNRSRYGLPTIQGTVVLHDAANGFPLAVMDSIEISIQRTGAATAVAAKFLARSESAVVAVAGCGAQGHVQLRALATVLPLDRAMVWDIESSRAKQMAATLARELDIQIDVVADFTRAAQDADVCVTCTPSMAYILGPQSVRPGTFVAGVGVDNPHKREIEPRLLAESTVVVDVLDQCASIGDLHHAVEAGLMTRESVHAELGAIVAGRSAGRSTADEVIVFDSTGMALQDVAAAIVVYERSLDAGVGTWVDFNS